MEVKRLILLSIAIGLFVLIETASAKYSLRRHSSRLRRSELQTLAEPDALSNPNISVSINDGSPVEASGKGTDISLEKKEGPTNPAITSAEASPKRKLKKNHRVKHKRLGGHNHHKRKLHPHHRFRNKKHHRMGNNQEEDNQKEGPANVQNPLPSDTINTSPTQTEPLNADLSDQRKSKRHQHRQHRKQSHKRLQQRRRRLRLQKQIAAEEQEHKEE